ncbi:MAG TPA: TIGR04551 family protein [Polyangia bacterium]|nr:TIGR04551 family protein [Polyangia bacterium]
MRSKIRGIVLARSAVVAGLTLLGAGRASAQMGGGGFGQPGGGMPPAQPMGQSPKDEGPAEEAPADETRPSDLEPLAGYAEQNKRRMQIVEFDGYLRLRADYMHNFFLGQGYTNLQRVDAHGISFNGTPPFPTPLECPVPEMAGAVTNAPGQPGAACGHKNVGGANLRLRIEPTINVTDQVRVHTQFDVLDNTLLGSTPDSLIGLNRLPTDPPGGASANYLYTTQYPPEVGQNGFVSSIRAKRAWAEIDTEFGSLRFGRMPWHWGRGIAYNDGNCPDCDGGTSVDRVMALTQLYGHQMALSWDLGAQGLTSQQLRYGRDVPGGYPIDLSQNDDVFQAMGAITKIDNPVRLRERIDRGDVVVNYGLQLVYRNQGNDVLVDPQQQPASGAATTTEPPNREQLPKKLLAINAIVFTPDVWFKLYFKALTIEFEGIGVFGKVDHPGPLAADDTQMTLRQLGWVMASELRLYRDTLFIGFETGGATGDQAEDPSSYLNYRWKFVQQPHNDHRLNDFKFSPDYHIDQILHRQIVGTVTNTIYVKPQVAYWFDLQNTRQLGLNGGVIYRMAQVPVATPGNSLSYGLEMNVGVNYRNTAEGFYCGATWAVLWPLGALERPATIWFQDAAGATAAQMLRIFMGVRF